MGHYRPLFSLFSSFQQFTVKMFIIKLCQRLDSKSRPLVLEATALPFELQPLTIHALFACQIAPDYIRCEENNKIFNY